MLQPVLVGRRLDVSPPVVLLGFWFGGWLWGVAGVALATPLLVSIRPGLREDERSRIEPRMPSASRTPYGRGRRNCCRHGRVGIAGDRAGIAAERASTGGRKPVAVPDGDRGHSR